MVNYESLYAGASYALDPNYGSFIGHNVYAGELALTTDPRIGNQLKEVSDKLNPGVKNIEISAISPEIFESIPEQHLKEINRQAKLVGAKMSVHGPLVEASGFTKQGWSEEARESAERQMKMAIERSHKIDPDGNIPVTFHSSAMLPGTIRGIEEKEGERKEVVQEMMAINRDTKQITPVKREERILPEEIEGKKPEEIKPEIRTPEKELDIINQSDWHQNLTQVDFYKNRGDEIIDSYYPNVSNIWEDIQAGKITQEQIKQLTDSQRASLNKVYGASEYIKNSKLVLDGLFNKAYKYGDDEEKRFLAEAAKDFGKKIRTRNPVIMSRAIEELAIKMQGVNPKLYVPLEDYTQDHSAKTFANVAFSAYKKFGDKSPIVSIENPPVGGAFSRAEDIKKLVEDSRRKFVENARKEGMSVSQAKSASEKLIGATWDVGHINMLRKYGYKTKEIVAETETISPYVKHVHLSDNFGFEHTELPMGMGTVPTKEILEKLNKAGFKGKKVIEAAQWWQHFKTAPLVPTMEALGSPLYSMKMAPYWNQVAYTQGNYFTGYGPIFPEQHFSTYGAGFSGMPAELGGQMPGKQSRFGGTPNQ